MTRGATYTWHVREDTMMPYGPSSVLLGKTQLSLTTKVNSKGCVVY